jgi:short-subunit dehydrogenase
VDIVVNNAGVGTPQSVLGEDVEKAFQLEVNAFGLLRG